MRSFHMFFMASIMLSYRVSKPTSTVFISFLVLIYGSKSISSCVISPSESVAIVGDLSSFSCNARPNNQQEGSISNIKLGSDTASGTYIFRPPSYGVGGRIITRQYLADGYSLSHLDDIHSNVTIQINETQLKHGGMYFCSCVESKSTLGTANFTVLDKLSFVRSGDEALTPGTLVDLNCSVSFNGSTSSAFINLTISDANGTEVSSERNLPLTKNVTGHHAIHYKVAFDPKEEQRFTCDVNVWNKSSTGESPLHSMSANFSLNSDHQPTQEPHSMSAASQATAHTAFIAVAVIVVAAVAVAVIFYKNKSIYKKYRAEIAQRRSAANQDTRCKDLRENGLIQHPPHMMPLNSADSDCESGEKEQGIVESNKVSEDSNSKDHSTRPSSCRDIL